MPKLQDLGSDHLHVTFSPPPCRPIQSPFPTFQFELVSIRPSKEVPSPNAQRSHSKSTIKPNTIRLRSKSCAANEKRSLIWPTRIGAYRKRSLMAPTMTAPKMPYFMKPRGKPIRSQHNFRVFAAAP